MTGPVMDKSHERVLGIPTERLRQAGIFQGFRAFDSDLFAFLLDPQHLEYRLRGPAEEDPSFKQLIPYVVLRYSSLLFHYTRGGKGAEKRLRALRSIGIGGHISADEDSAASDPYRAGMLRELSEEVEIQTTFRESMFGLINDDSAPVGQVHLGVVHLLELAAPKVSPKEDAIALPGFAPLAELQAATGEFETWSQFVMAAMRNS
ncbi:MAG TPA: phosphoesterase [Gemmataceae bacterium]|jgi:predicted NUDIX family phosphoesterase|nr:phosphoesterase [Gemmataceae bacterium]